MSRLSPYFHIMNLRFTLLCAVGPLVLTMVLGAAGSEAVPVSEPIREVNYRGRPALILSNDVLELTVLEMGGSLARLVLKNDPEKMNPLWDALRKDREMGRPERASGMTGHYTCLDGFGLASSEERAAGMPFSHGEAHSLPWVTRSREKQGQTATLVQTVYLPFVQEVLTRTLKLVDGENIVYAHSTLESLLAFDRPVCWVEHATVGSPFLEPGVTVVDLSGNRAVTRSRARRGLFPHRLAASEEFTWPMAPGVDGRPVNLRLTPKLPNSHDWTGHLWDPDREFAFVTVLHPEKRLLLGYVFRRTEYPWMQILEHYAPRGIMARGLEFGTQTFGGARRKMITQNKRFGQLLYRWLPAKSKIEANFLLFWSRTPEGFQGVDDIQVGEDRLDIRDKRSGRSFSLRLSQPF